MAIFKGQDNSQMCGTYGSLVFRNQGSSQIVQSKYSKGPTFGPFAIQARQYFGAASTSWVTLSASRRMYWENEAADLFVKDCAGNDINMSGQNFYIKIWLQAAEAIGLSVNGETLTGPKSYSVNANYKIVDSISANSVTGNVSIMMPIKVMPANTYTIIWISRPMGQKKTYTKGNLYRHVDAIGTITGPKNETANYVAHWGNVLGGTAGSKIIVQSWLVHTVSGQKSHNQVTVGIVQ